MSNIVQADIDPFRASILTGATFKVDWNDVKKVARKGRNGGEYEAPCILTELKGMVVPVWVQLTADDYDALRMLHIQGINTYTCTLGMKPDKGYAPRIFAGGKDW
jgi:hypothetical protein